MKRIVFLNGELPPQILGIYDPTVDGPELPVVLENFGSYGRHILFASLVSVTPRAAFYREPCVPTSLKTFNPRQA